MSSKAGRMFVSGPGCDVSVPFAFGAEAADADGPVADTPEPVTPEPVVTRSDSDGDDGDTVPHA